MGIERNIRGLQDAARNSGWRIKWIPWQEQGKPEYVYNTQLTLLTGFGGALMFVGAIAYILLAPKNLIESTNGIPRELFTPLVIAVSGILIAILGRIYAAWHKQSGWKTVRARCVDREIQKRLGSGKNPSHVWEYRLVCTFYFNGLEYTVTPESSHMVAFRTKENLEKYLDERIRADGTCLLYIDKKNPLHAVFHKKRLV